MFFSLRFGMIVMVLSLLLCVSILHHAYVNHDRLRCASKEDKSAGNLKRAREKESLWAQLETEQMADEDEAGHRVSVYVSRFRLQIGCRFQAEEKLHGAILKDICWIKNEGRYRRFLFSISLEAPIR